MDLKDELFKSLKGILNFLLWILKMKQKNIYKKHLTHLCLKYFITDTQEPSKQEQIQDGCIYIFKKGKNIGQKCGFWKFKILF